MQVFTHVHRCMYTLYSIHASFVYSVLVFLFLRELILLNRLDCSSSLDFCNAATLLCCRYLELMLFSNFLG